MLFFSRKKPLLGLDIGTHSIKLADIDMVKGAAKLRAFFSLPSPVEAMEGSDIVDSESVGRVLSDLLSRSKASKSSAAVALWGPEVFVKLLSIPKMEKKFVGEQLRWEVEQYLPYDIEDVHIDYDLVSHAQNSDEMGVLLVAAVRKGIMKNIEAVEHAKCKCPVVDVTGFALANCFEHNYPEMKDKVSVLVNIGAQLTTVVLMVKGEVVFVKDLNLGDFNYAVQLEEKMGLSPEEADSMKLEFAQGGTVPEEVEEHLRSVHKSIASEVLDAVSAFVVSGMDVQVEQCWLTGGGSKFPGLLDAFGSVVKTHTMNPFEKIDCSELETNMGSVEEMRDFAAVSVGLALRKEGDAA